MKDRRLKIILICGFTVVCAVVLTWFVYHYRHVGYYEGVAVVQPMLEVQESDTTACYWTKEILTSADFEGIAYNETNDKQICLRAYMRDSVTTLDTITSAVAKAIEKCSELGVKTKVTVKPFIASGPSTGQYIRYAVLSLLFSALFTGAVILGKTVISKY